MRIAVVIAGPYPALRGSQVLVAQTVAALSQCDHDVRVVSYGRRLADRPGFHPVRLPLNALLLARLARVVWRERIDIIHAHNYEALLVGLLVGRVMDRPVVYHGHSAMEDELPTYTRGPRRRVLLRRLGGWMDRAMPRCADASIAVTDQLADRLRTHGARHVRCLEPVLAPGSLVGADPAPTVISPNVVAYAGNLDAYQDLTFLLDAFSRVREAFPDAILRLVTHPGAARVADPLAGAGVEVVEASSWETAWAAVNDAAVVVSPREEGSGFPMKLLNYMAAGKAIVAREGAAKGLRDGETARIVTGGPKAFASAVMELLRDEEARDSLGCAARHTASDPSRWAAHLQTLDEIYEGLAADRRRSAGAMRCTE